MQTRVDLLLHFLGMAMGIRPSHVRAADGGTWALLKQLLVSLSAAIILGLVSGVGSAWFILQNDSLAIARQEVTNSNQQAINADQRIFNRRVVRNLESLDQAVAVQGERLKDFEKRR